MLEEALTRYRLDLEEKNAEIQAKRVLLEEKESTIFVMSSTMQEKEDELRESATETKAGREKGALLEQQVKDLTRAREEAEQGAADLREKLQGKDAELTALTTTIFQVTSAAATRDQEYGNIKEELLVAQTEVTSLRGELATAVSVSEERTKQHETASSTLLQELQDLRQELREKTTSSFAEKERLESQLKEQEGHAELSLRRSMQLEIEANSAKEQLQALTKQAAQTKTKLEDGARQQQQEAADREAALRQEVAALSIQVKALGEEKTKTQGDLQLFRTSYEGSLASLTSLKDETQKSEQRVQEFRASAERAASELDVAKTANARLRHELGEKSEKMVRTEAQALERQRAAERKDKERKELERQLREKEAQLKDLRDREREQQEAWRRRRRGDQEKEKEREREREAQLRDLKERERESRGRELERERAATSAGGDREAPDSQDETSSQKKRKSTRLMLNSPNKKLKEGAVAEDLRLDSRRSAAAITVPAVKLVEQTPELLTQDTRRNRGVVVAFSGFKHGNSEANNLETKVALEQAVLKLGGRVKTETEFDGSITHVVSPTNSRTVKTLAAVLTNKCFFFLSFFFFF